METKKSYKNSLRKSLQLIGQNVSMLSDRQFEIFQRGCVHYFCVIEPIIYTDTELLEEVREILYSINENLK